MKKKILIILLLFFFPIITFAQDVTKQFLVEINILENGDLYVRELATLAGTYNGRLRDIYYASSRAKTFTGQISDIENGSSIYNGAAIKDIKIADLSYKNNYTFDDFDNINKYYKLTSSDAYDYAYYNINYLPNGVNLKVYNNRSNAFYLEYVLENVIVSHNDIAELYWNILDESNAEYINELKIKIKLPGEDKDLRAWLYGSLDSYGHLELVDNNSVLITYLNLNAYEAVSSRVIFDLALAPGANKKSNMNAKQVILDYAKRKAKEIEDAKANAYQVLLLDAKTHLTESEELLTPASYHLATRYLNSLEAKDYQVFEERHLALRNNIDALTVDKFKDSYSKTEESLLKRDFNITESYYQDLIVPDDFLELRDDLDALEKKLEAAYIRRSLLLSGAALAIIIYIIKELKQRLKGYKEQSDFKHDYLREFPDDYDPAILEYLMEKRISDKSFSSTILNLIYKKQIEVEDIGKKNYLFTETRTTQLSLGEEAVMKILFDLVGNEGAVKLKDIKSYARSQKNAQRLLDAYNDFKSISLSEAKEQDFYKSDAKFIAKTIMQIFLSHIILIIISAYFEVYWLSFTLAMISIILIIINIVSVYYNSRTKVGSTKHAEWTALKNFMKDFGNFPEKELPEIKLWEKYLVYATVLGVATKLQQTMKTRLDSIQINDPNLNITAHDFLLAHYINGQLTRDINNAMASSIATANTTVNPSSHSGGGGFGGGSIGGGGFGGGGGGSGRF